MKEKQEQEMSEQEMDKLELKLKKDQVKAEQRTIQMGELGLKKLQNNYNRGLIELDFERESHTLMVKLYPLHGEKYVEMGEWKDYVVKVGKYRLKTLKVKEKEMGQNFLIAKSEYGRQQAEREKIVAKLKKRISEIKKSISKGYSAKRASYVG